MSVDLSLLISTHRMLRTEPGGERQLGDRRTQQSLETPPLNDDDDDLSATVLTLSVPAKVALTYNKCQS